MKRVLLLLLRAYKRLISPILPPACRFEPTCSNYFIQALERKGTIKGTLLGLWRLLRCQPFCRGGHDPVD